MQPKFHECWISTGILYLEAIDFSSKTLKLIQKFPTKEAGLPCLTQPHCKGGVKLSTTHAGSAIWVLWHKVFKSGAWGCSRCSPSARSSWTQWGREYCPFSEVWLIHSNWKPQPQAVLKATFRLEWNGISEVSNVCFFGHIFIFKGLW